MKLALLSFHDAANYGAALQSFGLQEALTKRGYDCEYINYKNTHRRNSYNMFHHIVCSIKAGRLNETLRLFLGTPFLLLRKMRFNHFYKKSLRCTKEIYSSAEEASKLNDCYDKFIVGSDQVWNPKNNGRDTAFLLSFVADNKKKIAYSSSFGLTEIPQEMEEDYRKYLISILNLSTREQFGVELIRKLTGREATLVLDPVFLLSKKEWEQVACSKRDVGSYIFSYTNRAKQLEDFLEQTNYDLNGKNVYKLSRSITVTDFIDSQVKVKYTMSPSDFLAVIRDAELVVSASFHCISLSIILNKSFVAILAGDKGKDERLLSLLSLLGLEKRILGVGLSLEEIDFEKVNKRIEQMREKSFSFLDKALIE